MAFKTETHLHVSQVSRCAHLDAKEMVTLYHRAGYHTLFVTDHLKPAYFEGDDSPWAQKIAWFFSGYRAAKEAGDTLGVTVLPGAEVTLATSPNHYLIYGAGDGFFEAVPGLFEMTPQALCDYAHEKGAVVVQAHPLRDGKCVPTPLIVDALEVFNPNPRHENDSPAVLALAEQYGLPMTAGSDAHRVEDVARAGVITEAPILCVKDYTDALLGRKLKLIGGETP